MLSVQISCCPKIPYPLTIGIESKFDTFINDHKLGVVIHQLNITNKSQSHSKKQTKTPRALQKGVQSHCNSTRYVHTQLTQKYKQTQSNTSRQSQYVAAKCWDGGGGEGRVVLGMKQLPELGNDVSWLEQGEPETLVDVIHISLKADGYWSLGCLRVAQSMWSLYCCQFGSSQWVCARIGAS